MSFLMVDHIDEVVSVMLVNKSSRGEIVHQKTIAKNALDFCGS